MCGQAVVFRPACTLHKMVAVMLSMAACQSVLRQAVLLLSLWRLSIVLQHGIARQTNKEREGEVSSMHGHTHTI